MRKVIVYRGESGYRIAECPSLSGWISQEKPRKGAEQNIREAIEGYILALRQDGLQVPTAKKI